MSISDEDAHHPLSTEIVTVLSHLVTGECWGRKGKAEGSEEDVVQETAAKKVWSNWVSHQGGSSEEYEDDEKKYEGELEHKVMEGNVGAEANITCCGIHAKVE